MAVALVAVLAACADDGPASAPVAAAPAVVVRASGCAAIDELAVGVVVADGLVLTVGHVLREAEQVTVDGVEGRVVAVDPRLDAAVIAVATSGAPLPMAAAVGPGPATIDGRPVTVTDVVVADVEEPRDATRYERRALILEADVTRGDSGSGVVAPDGTLLGMVFASSTQEAGVAYAVSAEELAPFVAAATTTPERVALTCTG